MLHSERSGTPWKARRVTFLFSILKMKFHCSVNRNYDVFGVDVELVVSLSLEFVFSIFTPKLAFISFGIHYKFIFRFAAVLTSSVLFRAVSVMLSNNFFHLCVWCITSSFITLLLTTSAISVTFVF